MEAARPAPDRWRAIAKWLGISMTALLHAEELLDEQESHDVQQAAMDAGMTELEWDALTDQASGDYFSQERSKIAEQLTEGAISSAQASNLGSILARIQQVASTDPASRWHPGQFRRRLPNDALAPTRARAALTATAAEIPSNDFNDAALLLSELVSNSVKHTDSEWIEVAIVLGTEVLRIEVSDTSPQPLRPRTPTAERGWGLALVAELATRWGVERDSNGKTIWVEFDLTGATPAG
jgi:anti-sigma regulatory factor (Ser/Thr protein kinase)